MCHFCSTDNISGSNLGLLHITSNFVMWSPFFCSTDGVCDKYRVSACCLSLR